ncbi:hypothetical protein [Ruania rhizosphaerae]|uniref:hypothetical protein n=1 Tax=Ruania rhizosphaerae TaxID=1840413 RepID=UPI00135A6D6E|nr:hypothetical protein [Ruania rhizosphaerae]
MATSITLTHTARPIREATNASGHLRVRLIDAGRGSSAIYPDTTLRAAAEARVFPAGTHVYFDHPSTTEDMDRPERSVRDLAGVTTTDAIYVPEARALDADVRVFSPYRTAVNEMADAIGLSIRGYIEGEHGEWEGHEGLIATQISEIQSVDFVTKAGRGGRVLQVIESARAKAVEARNVGGWFEARIHQAFTNLADEMYGEGKLTRDERITLSAGIGDALGAFTSRVQTDAGDLYARDLWDEPPTGEVTEARRGASEATANDRREQLSALVKDAYGEQDRWVWVRDFDEATVWFELDSGDDAGTYAQTYTTTGDAATALTGDRTEVRVRTEYIPINADEASAPSVPSRPAGQSTANESREDTMAQIQIEESRLAQLEKDAGRATALESERDQAITERDEARQTADAAAAARIVAEADYDFDQLQTRGLLADLPRTKEGRLDTEAFTTTVTTEAARLAETDGAGSVRGLGGKRASESEDLTEEELDRELGITRKEA